MNNSYNYYPNPAAPVKKKKGFSAWAAVLIVLAALVVIAAVVYAVVGRNPLLSVRKAVNTSLKAAQASEAVEIVSAAADCGSVEISLDGSGLTEDLLGVAINAGARVKFYFNLKNSSEAAAEAALSLNGAEAADLTAYTDGSFAAVKSEAILGTKTYGFRFDEVREKFDGSVWGPEGAYSLEELLGLDLTGEELAEILEPLASSGSSRDETEKVFKSVGADLLELVNKYADTETNNGELEFSAGGTVKTRNVIVTLEGEKLYDFLRSALEAIRDSERLNAFLDKHPELLEKAGLDGSGDFRSDADEAIEMLEKDRDEIVKYAAAVGFSISRENRQLVGVDFRVSERDGSGAWDKTAASGLLICGPDWEKPEEVRFELNAGDNTAAASCVTVYEDNGGLRSSLAVETDGEAVAEGSLEKDGATGAFTLKLSAMDNTLEAKGEYHRAVKDVTVIRLDSVSADGETYNLAGLTVTVAEKDEMPVIRDFSDALTMSEADVEKIEEDIDAFVETFREKLAETIGFLAYFLF